VKRGKVLGAKYFFLRRQGDWRYNVQQGPVCKGILSFLGVQQKVQQRYNGDGWKYSAPTFSELGDRVEEAEKKVLGDEGFEKSVGQVATIEKQLGIYEFPQFTPKS